MTTNVYVDGFNLYYGSLKGTAHKWLDLMALCRKLLPKDQIHRIRYFTALVSGVTDPQRPIRQQTYIRALQTIREVEVHYGQFRTNRVRMPLAVPTATQRFAEVLKTEEKGSDVNLATHLLLDGFRGDCDTAVVISNDSDLSEPINVARSELGLKIGVVNPHPPRYRSLQLKADFFKQLRLSAVAACQFPANLSDAQGQIVKPPTW